MLHQTAGAEARIQRRLCGCPAALVAVLPDGTLPTEVLSAVRMGLPVDRGLGEAKEPPGVPFLRAASEP